MTNMGEIGRGRDDWLMEEAAKAHKRLLASAAVFGMYTLPPATSGLLTYCEENRIFDSEPQPPDNKTNVVHVDFIKRERGEN